jgi:outer membrane lipoprotein-sorting protein
MKVWTKGEEKSLIRILKPKKEKGTTTLKVGKNVWNYLPKVNRIIKVPSSMMSGSWMGSHFTNDDLVKESRFVDDFSLSIIQTPTKDAPEWIVEATPKENAAIVWGKIVVRISKDRLPVQQKFFDEKGHLIRTLDYLDVQELSGKRLPTRMRVSPNNKPGEYTEFTQLELNLNIDVDEKMFTLQALKH